MWKLNTRGVTPVKSRFKALPPSIRTFLKSTFWTVTSRTRGKTPHVGYVRPLVGSAEGDGDFGPWTIAGVGGSFF